MPDPGLAVTVWTARLAVACYAVRVLADAGGFGSLRLRRWVWTAGWACFVLHLAAAFACVHGWSHEAAYRETARRTAAVTGLDWGGGLWVNYGFLLLWTADVAAWWAVGPEYPRRWRRTYVVVQAVFAFLMFNATAVFGPAFWRPVVAGFALLLAAESVVRARGKRRDS
jgi:hypothetical protein